MLQTDDEDQCSTGLVREPLPGKARQLGRSCPAAMLRAALLGTLAGLVVVGVTVRLSMGPVGANTQTMNLAEAAKKKGGKKQGSPFSQCGGKNWKKSTCCLKGCACIKDNMYYSKCTPPTGSQDCSTDLLKDEVDKAKDRVDAGQLALTDALDVLKTKKEPAKNAAANLKKAKKTVHDADANLKDRKRKELDGISKAKKENESVLKAAKTQKTKSIKAAQAERAKVEKDAIETLAKTVKAADDKFKHVSKEASETKAKVIKDATSEKDSKLDEIKKELDKATSSATKLAASEEKDAKHLWKKTVAEAKKDLEDTEKKAAAEQAKTEKDTKENKTNAESDLQNATAEQKVAYDTWLHKSQERGFVVDWINDYKKDEEFRKTKKCVALWGSCAGTCCPLGCKCNMQNAYYGTCNGMFGKKFCDWKTAVEKQNKSVKAMPKIDRDLHKLDVAKNKSEDELAKAKEAMKTIDATFDEKLANASKKHKTTVASMQKKHDTRVVAAKTKMEAAIAASKKEKNDSIDKAQAKAEKATKASKAKAVKTIADATDKFEKDTKDVREESRTTKKQAHIKADKITKDCHAKEKTLIAQAKNKEVDTIKPAMQQVLSMTTAVREARKKAASQKKKALEDRGKRAEDVKVALKNLLQAENNIKKKKAKLANLKEQVQTWEKASGSGGNHCGVDAEADLEV